MGTKLIGPDIGCNIDIATDIALWNTDTSSFITFSIFGKKKKKAAQYRLGPDIAATITGAK